MGLLIDALRFLNLFAAAIAVGGWILVLLAIVPTRERLPGGGAVTFHQASTERIDRYLPPTVAVSIVAAIAVVLVDRSLPPVAVASLLAGAVAMAVAAGISLGINMPMNRAIGGWSAEAPPAEAGATWSRWDRFHAMRTLSGVVALACFIGAAVSV